MIGENPRAAIAHACRRHKAGQDRRRVDALLTGIADRRCGALMLSHQNHTVVVHHAAGGVGEGNVDSIALAVDDLLGHHAHPQLAADADCAWIDNR